MMKGLLIGIGVVVLLAVGLIMYGIGISNTEIKLRSTVNAQQTNCKLSFSNMWGILKDKAQVTDQYKDAFAEIYPKLMEGRYSDEGKGQETFMKWIVEANPTFDVSLYKDLMDAIKGERDSFLMQQRLLVDKQREHHNLLTLFPSKLFVGSRPEIAIVTIETTIGKEAYKTGVDDNVLFEKKK